MEESSSPIYKQAIRSSISNRFTRSFRTELHAFKVVKRQIEAQVSTRELEAAEALNSLGTS